MNDTCGLRVLLLTGISISSCSYVFLQSNETHKFMLLIININHPPSPASNPRHRVATIPPAHLLTTKFGTMLRARPSVPSIPYSGTPLPNPEGLSWGTESSVRDTTCLPEPDPDPQIPNHKLDILEFGRLVPDAEVRNSVQCHLRILAPMRLSELGKHNQPRDRWMFSFLRFPRGRDGDEPGGNRSMEL